jgi:K+-transporting ATPase ATPase C chain
MPTFAELRAAVVLLLGLTLVTGVVYPLLVTGVAQAALAKQANGSLVFDGKGNALGSSLIGQPFDDPKYFWSRPSATPDANGKPLPYNGQSSYASNLGPTNPALTDAVSKRIAALKAADPAAQAPVPVDLVTTSGSGLDPDITPAAALYQLPRVAKARGLDEATVRALVERATTRPPLGEVTVNVLALNLSLDAPR